MEEKNGQPHIPGESIQTLRTYSSDMADAVRENEVSVIKIALAEKAQQEKEALYKQAEGTGTQKFLLITGSIVLVVGAIIGSYFLIKKTTEKSVVSEQAIVKNPPTFISYDTYTYVDATNAATVFDLAGLIEGPLAVPEKPQSIQAIFLTKSTTIDQKTGPVSSPLSTDGLLSILNLTAPQALTRTLDSYMIGTYRGTDASSSFLIFETKDYGQAYASMLSWEQTMLNDVYPLFGIDVSGDRSALLTKQFKDVLIENKDARVLYDADGKAVLYYIFVNNNEFVISGNLDAIQEIISRLRTQHTPSQ